MNKVKDIIILGFAIFALLFGAGNLIFPPILGLNSGTYWLVSLIGFLVTDVLLSFMALLDFNHHGSLEQFGAKIGIRFIRVFNYIGMFVIMGLFIIPRTAATTYEIAIKPFYSITPLSFYVVFFLAALFLAIKQSKVLDNLGKIISPTLFILIMVIVIQGIFNPISNYKPSLYAASQNFGYGFITGYQTADPLGLMLSMTFVISTITLKGYKSVKDRKNILLKSGILTMTLLIIVYTGLAFLGAKFGGLLPKDVSTIDVLRKCVEISSGKYGNIILSFIVFFACFTTCIGVLGMVGEFIEKETKLSYKHGVVIFSIVGIFVAKGGVDAIIKFASPILNVLYPLFIMLVLLNTFKIKKHIVYKLSIYTAFVVSLLDVLRGDGVSFLVSLFHFVPFTESGFAWVVPSLIACMIGLFIPEKINERKDYEIIRRKRRFKGE